MNTVNNAVVENKIPKPPLAASQVSTAVFFQGFEDKGIIKLSKSLMCNFGKNKIMYINDLIDGQLELNVRNVLFASSTVLIYENNNQFVIRIPKENGSGYIYYTFKEDGLYSSTGGKIAP